jgi:23S rRNA (cytosine1962-C5)-methyltransferase
LTSTYLTDEAARRLRHGVPWIPKDGIASIDGAPNPGEPVVLKDAQGHTLGLADVDLESSFAVRRLGLPEEAAEGIIQRHLRHALERRALLVDDPRFCRMVNDDGDGLPGLVIDRYDTHYVVQTFTRAMDARVQEISRSLVEVMNARSVLLRNDSLRRGQLGLKRERSHVMHGTPPRWSRVLEMGARFTVDLYSGRNTGYFYDHRDVRKVIARLSQGARVLDVCGFVGGLFVHAGLHGAKSILAFESDEDAAELARENAEANGLMSRTRVEHADAHGALEQVQDKHDLVLLDAPELPAVDPSPADPFVKLVRGAVRATRHGGRLIVIGYHPPLPERDLDERIALACELESRFAVRLARPGLPADFPTVVGSPGAEYMTALALELS